MQKEKTVHKTSPMLLWFVQLWLVHDHLQDRFHDQNKEMTLLQQAVCLPKLHAFQVYHPPVTIHLLHLYLGSAFNPPLKPLHFLYIQDWHPSQKIELLPTPLRRTPQGCFPESLSECRFLLQIIILVFLMFTLRPLACRCRVVHP